MTERCDVVIIGGGATGLMCARVAGRRGRSVLILDHAKRPAEKIRISGGGRCNFTNMHSSPAAFLSNAALGQIGARVNRWQVSPSGTEGYRTAEVTVGGVDVDELSSKTIEAKVQPGLYFIGEVVDVTGHLGGYNFQWA